MAKMHIGTGIHLQKVSKEKQMRTFKALFVLIAALGVAAVFTPVAAQLHTNDAMHDSHHDSHFVHLTGLPHAHVALDDMHSYASHHLGDVTELPETYGEADHWAHDWELRWVDYQVSGHVVRVYHAINKHDDGVRYASSWDGHQARYHDWVPIH
jgi:hypothetical protein